jgi:23S rRNA (adenine1618-N6)-methyltransferase
MGYSTHYLCPPIPGRADYIHYIADLLADNNGIIPKVMGFKAWILVLALIVIIGNAEYGWSFVGTDIDEKLLKIAVQ